MHKTFLYQRHYLIGCSCHNANKWAHACFSVNDPSNLSTTPLQWRHYGRGGASNYRRLDCVLNRLLPVTGAFAAQRASNAENISIWWRHLPPFDAAWMSRWISSWVENEFIGVGCGLSPHTVYPKKYPHGFVVLCFIVVMQSFIMDSHEVFIHIHQGCFAGTGAIVRLPQCQWSKPDGYGKISQCITTTNHSKAKTVCIFLGIYCILQTTHFYETISRQDYN